MSRGLASGLLIREAAVPLTSSILLCLLSAISLNQASALPAGFQEFYLPLPADLTQDVFQSIHGWNQPRELMHYLVAVTASGDNTVVYYDHWEVDGLEGPGAAGYDEVVHLNKGETHVFESANIPSDFRGAATYYDGGDRIYVAGGLLQVVVSTWAEALGTVFTDAWEIYPVQAWGTSYAVPVGQDLGQWPHNYDDFDAVYILVMSATDGNQVTIDGATTTLSRGQSVAYSVPKAGTWVTSTHPVQVQLVTGQPGSAYEMRGYTITPYEYWGSSYYAAVPSWPPSSDGNPLTAHAPYTDIFLYNPNPFLITITWQDLSGCGTIYLEPGETRSFQASTWHHVPTNSGVYLSSSHKFWGIASCDTESFIWDWGYSLIPEALLGTDNYVGWAPGTRTLSDNGSPVYIMATSDHTTIFIDYSPNDGIFDRVISDLDRLHTIEVYDPDMDNTGMHIVSTAPVAVVWGESPISAGAGDPYLDMGYACLPLPIEWVDLALEIDKSAEPGVIRPGEAANFRIMIRVPSYAGSPVTGIGLVDALPSGWLYLAGSGSPTDPTVTGDPADGCVLAWDLQRDLCPGQSLTVTFKAVATPSADTTKPNRNVATVTGRSLGVTLAADDDAFVQVVAAHNPAILVTKTGPSTARIGDTVTYTITVQHDPSSDNSPVHDLKITDSLTESVTFVSGDDGDGVLDYPEIWTYIATYTVLPTDPDPLLNIATAEGLDLDGDIVSDTDTHNGADLEFAPAILVTKTGPSTARIGDTVTYTITVQHDPSSDGSDVTNVSVTDDIAGPALYLSGDDGDGILEPGEVWVFAVEYAIPADAPNPLRNTATCSGIDKDGEMVFGHDDHSVLVQSGVDPPSVPVFPAAAIAVAMLGLCVLSRRKS